MLSTTPFYLQQFHKDGEPLSGGKLYTYIGGSTNAPKATYVDPNGITESPNPIILSSQGICPQFWCEAGIYKFVLTDSSGNEIASRDYVDGLAGGATITGDHKVMVNGSDTPSYLGDKIYADGGLVVQEVEVDPGVYNLHVFPDPNALQAKPTGAAGGDLAGTYPDPIVKQLTGVEAALLPIESDFTFSTTPAGTGIGPGRQYLAGVEVRCWVSMGFDGHLRWTRNDFASTTLDAGLWSRGIGTHWNCIRFLYMAAFSSWAWVAGDGDHQLIYYALHNAGNYNADGTIKSVAWNSISFIGSSTPPPNVGDIAQGLNNVACFVGDWDRIGRTVDFSTFTSYELIGENIGGIDTDSSGAWLVIRRDTGELVESIDNGITWTTVNLLSVDGLAAAHLPVNHNEQWGSLNYGYGKWLAAVYNAGSGRISYAYSIDRRIWTTYTSPSAASFFSAAFDGRKWLATNPAASPPIWQLLFSEIPAHKRLICEDGLISSGSTFFPDLANAQVITADKSGLLVAQDWINLSNYSNASEYRVGGTVVIDSTQNVKGTTLWSGGAIRADANGDGTYRNMSLTGWMVLNGASRPAWGGAWAPTMLGGTSAISCVGAATGTVTVLSNNLYSSQVAELKAIESGSSNRYPCYFMLDDQGGIELATSLIPPTAGGIITDMVRRWRVSREGRTTQFASEPVASAQYVKTTDTTIGPSAAAKASLLNGGVAAGGFAAVSEPAGRWNVVGAQSDTHLKGRVSSVANQVLAFELYRNGVSVATLTLPARTYGTNTPWRLEIDQDVRVSGVLGTVRVDMRAYVTADNASSQASCYQMDSTLTGVNLTVAATWDVVCTIPNNAANSITCIKARKVG